MKTYLNSKLVLFKKILKSKSVIISDKEIQPYLLLKLIARKKKHKLINIDAELKKIKKFLPDTSSDFRKKSSYGNRSNKIMWIKRKINL